MPLAGCRPMMRRALFSAVFLVTGLVACAGEDDAGAAQDQDLTVGGAIGTALQCPLSWDAILEGTTGPQRKVIERARLWVDAGIGYSQEKWYANPGESKEYRTDCSGFVSMAWQKGSSPSTASYINQASSDPESIYQLKPGDAAVRRVGDDGHIFIFLKETPLGACVAEQNWGLGAQTSLRPYWTMKADGYRRIAR